MRRRTKMNAAGGLVWLLWIALTPIFVPLHMFFNMRKQRKEALVRMDDAMTQRVQEWDRAREAEQNRRLALAAQKKVEREEAEARELVENEPIQLITIDKDTLLGVLRVCREPDLTVHFVFFTEDRSKVFKRRVQRSGLGYYFVLDNKKYYLKDDIIGTVGRHYG